MKSLFFKLLVFIVILFGGNYWHLWYKLGPSIIKDILKRITGKKEKKIRVKNPKIEKFLGQLNYRNFYIIESPIAFGMAHPFSKDVVVSSKIYNSSNFNLLKYVLAHEIAHKKQGNTKTGVIFFLLAILTLVMAEYFWQISIWFTIILALVLGRIAFYGQRKFEDMADKETARIIGKENFFKAIHDLFILNGNSLGKGGFWKEKLLFSRDLPGRINNIKKI